MAAAGKTRYRVNVGINYPPNDTRAEPGDIVDDIPTDIVKTWLAEGVIERYKEEKED